MMKLKGNTKFGFILGVLLTSAVSVMATSMILSKNISYSNSNTDVTNVEDALNELYEGKSTCNYSSGSSFLFSYTGASQPFVVPCNGYYRIELWGAQGGSLSYTGGAGAYVSGITRLSVNKLLYFFVGGVGGGINQVANIGGFNGGGYSGNYGESYSSGGGGATDVRVTDGLWNDQMGLKSRVMVAAGGSGMSNNARTNGVPGGGLHGIDGLTYDGRFNNYSSFPVTGATQIAGGKG
ncbi:MAG TPA: glycine rich domain-containing protein, partial [Bacilli bacterium]|nr:glycine rich domain-containing protein [Bacilli bacterium]